MFDKSFECFFFSKSVILLKGIQKFITLLAKVEMSYTAFLMVIPEVSFIYFLKIGHVLSSFIMFDKSRKVRLCCQFQIRHFVKRYSYKSLIHLCTPAKKELHRKLLLILLLLITLS